MLLMKRLMDGSDSMSNASTRSSSSGGSGGTFQKNWQPGFFRVNLSPFGSGKGKMLTMAEAMDWKQCTKKTNKEGKVHTLILYKATQTGGGVLEEITAMVNLRFQAAADKEDFVAKSEVHPARAQRTKALFTMKELVEQICSTDYAAANVELQWQPKPAIQAYGQVAAILSNTNQPIWQKPFLTKSKKKRDNWRKCLLQRSKASMILMTIIFMKILRGKHGGGKRKGGKKGGG